MQEISSKLLKLDKKLNAFIEFSSSYNWIEDEECQKTSPCYSRVNDDVIILSIISVSMILSELNPCITNCFDTLNS